MNAQRLISERLCRKSDHVSGMAGKLTLAWIGTNLGGKDDECCKHSILQLMSFLLHQKRSAKKRT